MQGPAAKLRKILARDANEGHRAATPLELLFDLVFVVAIAQAAASLHHSISGGHVVESIAGYVMVFFAIWWAWMGFTWFASAFDSDDAPYRLKVGLQMTGLLALAAGVPAAFEEQNYLLVTIGYTIMRVGLLAQWGRVYWRHPEYRATAGRYMVGVAACQLGWISLLLLPHEQWMYGWLVLVPLELAVPYWAEKQKTTPWHPHHVAERYGLLTIIVIGESVLAGTLAVQVALDEGHLDGHLLRMIVGAPVLFFSMWWLYFARPHHVLLCTRANAFVWGYTHYLVYAAAAAVGAGLAAAIDVASDHSKASALTVGYSLAVPIVLYLLGLWLVQFRHACQSTTVHGAFVAAGLTLLVVLWTGAPVLGCGLVLAVLTTVVVRKQAVAFPTATNAKK
jgi:low temperature requirement protein LtrA